MGWYGVGGYGVRHDILLSEQPGNQRGQGCLDVQDALAEADGTEAAGCQHRDLERNEPALRTHRQRDGPARVPGAVLRGPRMGDQVLRPRGEPGQFILHERLEPFLEQNFRQDRITGLFKPEKELFPDRGLAQERRLPVALLDAGGVDQDDALHAHDGEREEYPPEDLRPGKRENERERQGRRRVPVEMRLHLEGRCIDLRDPAGPDLPAQETDVEHVAR